jgi:hypothetical protein
MSRLREGAGCLAIFSLVALCAACGARGNYDPSADGLALIVTQLPAETAAERVFDPADPGTRYPVGSRIVLARPGSGPADVLVLSGELQAAGGPALSPDGFSVLFAGRQGPQSNWAIYEVSLQESRPRPRRITDSGTDCVDPAFLPGERIVCTCSDGARWQLHTASRDGQDRQGQVTFGAGESNYPSVLRDGRVLFTMSQGPGAGRPDPGMTALFTVNPDGSLPGTFAGSHTGPALKLRARQTATDDVIYIAAGRHEKQRIESVPLSRPDAAPRVITLAWHDTRRSVSTPLDATSVEPLRDGSLLVVAKRWGVFLAPPGSETAARLFDDPTRDEIEAIPVAVHIEPRGRPVVIRPEADTGTLVCYDSGRSDGVIGPGADDPVAASMTIETRDGAEPSPLRLEEDGSFLIEAPADVPLRVVSRDAGGGEIAASDWFWIRPGEVRACFGCHEGHEAAPVNRVVQAIDIERRP